MLRQLLKTFISPRVETTSFSREQSEKKLKFSELRYRRLFETAQDGILILDANTGKIDDVNPFLQKLLGYSRNELIGKQLWEIGVFKDIADSKDAFIKLKNKEYIRYEDLPLETKNGNSIDVEFVSNTYLVGDKKVIQCNIRDITTRKKAEAAIEIRTKELERLTKSQGETKKAMLNIMEDLEQAKATIELEKIKDDAILASIGDGIIAIDEDGKIILVNQAGCDLLGSKTSTLLERKLVDVVKMVDKNGTLVSRNKRPELVAITGTKSTTSLTGPVYYYIREDGTQFPVAITVTPIINDKTIGAIEVFRDITHEIEIDKAKSEFVSLASHQLRTPLGIIKWYLEALGNEDYFKKAPKVIRKYFDEIYNSNERVLSLVRNLLTVSKIDQKQIKDCPKSADLIEIIRETVKQMQVLANKKKVTLRLAIKNGNMAHISIDILRFHEVIENIIGNAIEYTMAGGSVDVNIDKTETTFLISVKDTGMGMSALDKKMLFTKFFRSEKAIKNNPEGSGLGLYVAKSYVEGWGGKISVESSEKKSDYPKSGGSTFLISLPISQKND